MKEKHNHHLSSCLLQAWKSFKRLPELRSSESASWIPLLRMKLFSCTFLQRDEVTLLAPGMRRQGGRWQGLTVRLRSARLPLQGQSQMSPPGRPVGQGTLNSGAENLNSSGPTSSPCCCGKIVLRPAFEKESQTEDGWRAVTPDVTVQPKKPWGGRRLWYLWSCLLWYWRSLKPKTWDSTFLSCWQV